MILKKYPWSCSKLTGIAIVTSSKPGAAFQPRLVQTFSIRKLIRFPIEIIRKPPAKPEAAFQPRKVHWHVKLFIIVC